VIDENGFRLNVGIIVLNSAGKVLVANRRNKKQAWQFPQGGMREDETTIQSMYRELEEELGLCSLDVTVVKESDQWLCYRLPVGYWRLHSKPLVIGQKQKWFLLKLISPDNKINLANTDNPEFSHWRWVDYWQPAKDIIDFKRDVYNEVLKEFEPLVK